MYESVPFLVKCTSSSGTALVASFTEVRRLTCTGTCRSRSPGLCWGLCTS